MNNINGAEMQQFGTVWPQCVARAWEDVKFREDLKRDPAGTLRAAYQFVIPAGVELQVVEGPQAVEAQQANVLTMVIPPMPDVDMGEIALVSSEGERARKLTFRHSATLC